MKKRQKIVSMVMLAMLAVLFLVGCSESTSPKTEKTEPTTATAEETTITTEATATEETEPITTTETPPTIKIEDLGFQKAESIEEAISKLFWFTPYEEDAKSWTEIEDISDLDDLVIHKGFDYDTDVYIHPGYSSMYTNLDMYNYEYPWEAYGPMLVQNKATKDVYFAYGPFEDDLVHNAKYVDEEWNAVWLTDFGRNRTKADSGTPIETPDKTNALPLDEIWELIQNGEPPRLDENDEPYAVEDNVKLFLADGTKITSPIAGLQLLALNKQEFEYANSVVELRELQENFFKLYYKSKEQSNHDLEYFYDRNLFEVLEAYIIFNFSPILVREDNGKIFVICGYTPNDPDEQYENFFRKVWVLSEEEISPVPYSYEEFIQKYGRSEYYEAIWFNNYYTDGEGNSVRDAD